MPESGLHPPAALRIHFHTLQSVEGPSPRIKAAVEAKVMLEFPVRIRKLGA